MVKNLPSSAGDVGLIPGRGTKIPYAAPTPQLESPRAATMEPIVAAREKPKHHNERSRMP